MPSDPRKECPSCLRPMATYLDARAPRSKRDQLLCWNWDDDDSEGGRECYARLCAMQAVAPDMVRVLERVVAACFAPADVVYKVVADAQEVLSRAKGDHQ